MNTPTTSTTLPTTLPIDAFFAAYIKCGLLLGDDDLEYPLMGRPFADGVKEELRDDCRRFVHANAEALLEYVKHCNVTDGWGLAGQDFWLTRNGAGIGYWARDCADGLDKAAIAFPPISLYLGDDGFVYFM